jgi:hypothetical protein
LNQLKLDIAASDKAQDFLLRSSGVEGVTLEMVEKLLHLDRISMDNFRI